MHDISRKTTIINRNNFTDKPGQKKTFYDTYAYSNFFGLLLSWSTLVQTENIWDLKFYSAFFFCAPLHLRSTG